MTVEPRKIDTSVAILQRIRPDYIEVQYLSNCVFNSAALAEVQQARRELMGKTPYSMLSIIPEDVDYELSAMNVDHLAQDRKEGALLAIAVVTHANMMEMVLKLYFSYYPQLSRIKVTSVEAEAREWLTAQMEDMLRTG